MHSHVALYNDPAVRHAGADHLYPRKIANDSQLAVGSALDAKEITKCGLPVAVKDLGSGDLRGGPSFELLRDNRLRLERNFRLRVQSKCETHVIIL